MVREGAREGKGGDTTYAGAEEEEEGVAAVKNGSMKSESPCIPDADDGCDGEAAGRRRGEGAGVSDADFDEVLASYLDGGDPSDERGDRVEGDGRHGGGAFGKAGGSLLMPLGALRLLRWVQRSRERRRGNWLEEVESMSSLGSNVWCVAGHRILRSDRRSPQRLGGRSCLFQPKRPRNVGRYVLGMCFCRVCRRCCSLHMRSIFYNRGNPLEPFRVFVVPFVHVNSDHACCVSSLPVCCFRHLSSLSGGRGLVLVGDKGYISAEEMKGDRDPHIAYHGSLSCMVSSSVV